MDWLKDFLQSLLNVFIGNPIKVPPPLNPDLPEVPAPIKVEPPKKKDLLAELYKEAYSFLGITEKSAPQLVKMFHNATTEKGAGITTAWCSSFVNHVVQQYNMKGTRSAYARSWLKWAEELKTPRKGCIVVLTRGNPKGPYGHVGFFHEIKNGSVYILGGNQDNSVSIKAYDLSRVLSYRCPIGTGKI